MWLFFVETYLFVLVAFTAGIVVGLVGVRAAVRRTATAPTPRAKQPKAKGEKRRGRKAKAADPDHEPAGASAAGGST